MGRVPDAQRAVALPWLRPSAAGLLALTDSPPARAAVLDCPGTVAHVLRYARPTPDPANFCLSDDLLGQPGLSAAAAEFVESNHGWPADWQSAAASPLNFGRTAARVASGLASETGACSPDAAWAAALLSPLGWYAAASDPVPGFDPVPVGRRLAFRWRLPTPFALTIGSPELPPDDVARLGGHLGLHRVVRAAAAAVERRLRGIGLKQTSARPDHELDAHADRLAAGVLVETVTAAGEPDPKLLAKLLRLTAAARRQSGVHIISDLETQVDALTGLLAGSRAGFDAAVQDAKLSALAEFAAGAGHEINNPLAVVSGNAQLLLSGEADPERRRRLGAVIRAAGRIHDILVGTRQFARPPAPALTAVPLWESLAAVCEANRPAADDRGVRLDPVAVPGDPLAVRADIGHFRQIVGNLLRNGIEAAPRGGWVRAGAEVAGNRVEVVVEDSGPGPGTDDVPHLFDPFFSGREAGRGRGLGLSQAWQLARQNGGAVAYSPRPGGPTRFTLTLERAEPSAAVPGLPADALRSA